MTVTELKRMLEKAEEMGYGEATVARFSYSLFGNDYYYTPITQVVVQHDGADLLTATEEHHTLRLT